MGAVSRGTIADHCDHDRLPSRTTVAILGLAGGGDIEIDLIVYCTEGSLLG